jgi:hypothetical protein
MPDDYIEDIGEQPENCPLKENSYYIVANLTNNL